MLYVRMILNQRVNIFLYVGQADSRIHLACLMLMGMAPRDVFEGCTGRQIPHDEFASNSKIST